MGFVEVSLKKLLHLCQRDSPSAPGESLGPKPNTSVCFSVQFKGAEPPRLECPQGLLAVVSRKGHHPPPVADINIYLAVISIQVEGDTMFTEKGTRRK